LKTSQCHDIAKRGHRYRTIPQKLLAVFDKHKHNHPPDIYHVYKIFILCKDSGEEIHSGMETTGTGWFGRDEIPPLSELRITKEQVATMFEFLDNTGKEALYD